MKNFSYSIGAGYQLFDSLAKARRAQRRIIKSDKTVLLYRDNKGYFIKRYSLRGSVREFR